MGEGFCALACAGGGCKGACRPLWGTPSGGEGTAARWAVGHALPPRTAGRPCLLSCPEQETRSAGAKGPLPRGSGSQPRGFLSAPHRGVRPWPFGPAERPVQFRSSQLTWPPSRRRWLGAPNARPSSQQKPPRVGTTRIPAPLGGRQGVAPARPGAQHPARGLR